MARKKIKGTKEKLIRLSEETIEQLRDKAHRKNQPVKTYIETIITNHAKR